MPVTSVRENHARPERVLPLLGLVLTGVMVAMSYIPPSSTPVRQVDALAVALLLVTAASVVVVRRWPVVALIASLLASAVWFPAGYAGAWPATGLVISIYVVSRNAATRRPLVAVVAIVLVSSVSMVAAGVDSFVTAIGILGWMAAAALLGDAVRQRAELVAAHADQLASVEARQAAEVERRTAEERLAIARDLHDVLAHTLAAVSLHAGAAADQVPPGGPAAAHLAQVRQSISDAVADVRRSISGLRTPTHAGALPGWHALDALVDECRTTGPQVDVRVEGVVLGDLPELVGVCTYRLAQEGITNIRRHSQAASAVLDIRAVGHDLQVTLEDRGPRRLPTGVPGHGLTGMAERVRAAGGEFAAGATANGGFRVSATFVGIVVPA